MKGRVGLIVWRAFGDTSDFHKVLEASVPVDVVSAVQAELLASFLTAIVVDIMIRGQNPTVALDRLRAVKPNSESIVEWSRTLS